MTDIVQKLISIQSTTKSNWALYISPVVEALPFEIQRYDDPYLPYMRAIYGATHDLVCAYILDLGAYLSLGGAGAVALERSIDLIGGDHMVILDAAIASSRYAGLWEEMAYGCDALTVADAGVLWAYQARADRAAFLMTTDAVDSRLTPTYWMEARMFGLGAQRIRLLPDDVLAKARSLTFEDSLRAGVSELVRG